MAEEPGMVIVRGISVAVWRDMLIALEFVILALEGFNMIRQSLRIRGKAAENGALWGLFSDRHYIIRRQA